MTCSSIYFSKQHMTKKKPNSEILNGTKRRAVSATAELLVLVVLVAEVLTATAKNLHHW